MKFSTTEPEKSDLSMQVTA